MESENRNGAYALAYGLVGFVPMFGLLFGVLSIVKGIAGMNRDESRKLSIAGLVIGIISIIFNVVFFIFFILPFFFVLLIFYACCCQFAEV